MYPYFIGVLDSRQRKLPRDTFVPALVPAGSGGGPTFTVNR